LGELLAVSARGTPFGNRGGRFRSDAQTLMARRLAGEGPCPRAAQPI